MLLFQQNKYLKINVKYCNISFLIRNLIIFSWNDKPSNQVIIPLKNPKNMEVIMQIKVLVGGSANSPNY